MGLFCEECKFLQSFLLNILEFCPVDQKKTLRLAAVGTVGYLAFRALQLRRTVQDLFIGIQKVEFSFNRARGQGVITPIVEIINPVGGQITISNIYGTLRDDKGNEYGIFQTGRFLLTRSTTLVKFPINLSTFGVVSGLIDNIQNNRYPKLTLSYTITIAGGLLPIRDKITFDTAVLSKAVNFVG
jgi:hypothetical protein